MTPEHLSHSQISLLGYCGEAYRRRYVALERQPTGLGLVRGLAVDDSINANLRARRDEGELLELDEVRATADASFSRRSQTDIVFDGDYLDVSPARALGHARDTSIKLATLHARKFAPSLDPLFVQHRITIPAGRAIAVPFVVVLDLVESVSGGVAIRDNKTTARKPKKNAAHVSEQLSAQVLGYRSAHPEPVRELSLDVLEVASTGSGRALYSHHRQSTSRTRADLGVFVERARAALRVIEAEAWVPAPVDSWKCSERWCGFWSTCRYARRGVSRASS